ncbi:hypothetical protein VIC_002396 [Vibrio coralliilyticus ATCC BAA-450]|nr:hypothetical protein VIC_002396 [Vibrio coralliilyticus ATCC BAA-450]
MVMLIDIDKSQIYQMVSRKKANLTVGKEVTKDKWLNRLCGRIQPILGI